MTCHALNCPNPALPGMPQCYEHWMMLPARVRESQPWVERLHAPSKYKVEPVTHARQFESESGQMEMFA